MRAVEICNKTSFLDCRWQLTRVYRHKRLKWLPLLLLLAVLFFVIVALVSQSHSQCTSSWRDDCVQRWWQCVPRRLTMQAISMMISRTMMMTMAAQSKPISQPLSRRAAFTLDDTDNEHKLAAHTTNIHVTALSQKYWRYNWVRSRWVFPSMDDIQQYLTVSWHVVTWHQTSNNNLDATSSQILLTSFHWVFTRAASMQKGE